VLDIHAGVPKRMSYVQREAPALRGAAASLAPSHAETLGHRHGTGALSAAEGEGVGPDAGSVEGDRHDPLAERGR